MFAGRQVNNSMIYYNTQHSCIYMMSPRTGSSLMYDISLKDYHLRSIRLETAFQILQGLPDTEVIFVYRDPAVRFKSGLGVVAQGPDATNINATPIENAYHLTTRLRSLKNFYAQGLGKSHFYMLFPVPYHLMDAHLAHILWKPLLMGAHGYNVTMLNIDNLSEHLRKKHAGCESEITRWHRPNSGTCASSDSELLWQAYSDVFLSNNHFPSFGSEPQTWTQWMIPEESIYMFFKTHGSPDNLQQSCEDHLRTLLENTEYFNDLMSPVFLEAHVMTNLIERYGGQKSVLFYHFDTMLDKLTAQAGRMITV